MVSANELLLVAGILLLLAVVASKASGRLGIPALLLFLVLGMLAGSDGPGGIYFDDAGVAQSLGVLALALILFSGGLDTEWKTVRPIIVKGTALSTVGVLITAVLVGLFATAVLGFGWLGGLLLGAIVSSTDAAAVFSVLRARRIGLKGNVKPLLELESGSNDPMAIFLTIGFTRLLVDPAAPMTDLVWMFLQQMALGAVVGFTTGRGAVLIINRLRLEYEGLYPVLTLSLVLLTYGLTAYLGGNGFLAVYLAALIMGNSDFIHKKSLIRFHDGLAWLMQITMFLTLGLLVFPSRLIHVIGAGLLASAFLIFIARPVSVFLTLLPNRLEVREKLMLSWVGLRGAVPIVLATFPLLAGVPQADTIFNLVFFIVLTSVLLQGTSVPLVARWLDVDEPATETMYPLEFSPTEDIRNVLEEIVIPANSAVVGKPIVELGFPKGALVVLICRNREFLVPGGGEILQAADKMLVLGDKASIGAVRSSVDIRRTAEEMIGEQRAK